MPTRLLLCVVLLSGVAEVGHAQNGCARLSWETCDPWIMNKNYAGPFVYRVVESIYGVDVPNVGTDSQIRIYFGQVNTPPPPDAWAFYDGGCQGASQLAVNADAVGADCPAMGASPIVITHYAPDPNGHSFVLRLSASYAPFVPSAGTRYAIWQILFNHAFSSQGPNVPDQSSCGGVNLGAQISFDFADVIATSGPRVALPACDQYPGFCGYLDWNGGIIYYDQPECSPVATLPTTWGRVKGLYR